MTQPELERKYAKYYVAGKRAEQKLKKESNYVTVNTKRKFSDPRPNRNTTQNVATIK